MKKLACRGESGKRTLPVVQPARHPDGWGAPPSERRDAAEHRRRILATARELFAARGVEAVTMHEIARAVGVGQGTLYRRFAHKGLLCGALLEDNTRRFQEEVIARLGYDARVVGREPESALACLDFFLARLVQFNEENAPLLGALADKAGGPGRSVYGNPIYGFLRQTVSALLRRAVAEGEIPPLDIPVAADAVLAPLGIDLYLHQRRDQGLAPDRILASARRIVFGGLRGGGVVETAHPRGRLVRLPDSD